MSIRCISYDKECLTSDHKSNIRKWSYNPISGNEGRKLKYCRFKVTNCQHNKHNMWWKCKGKTIMRHVAKRKNGRERERERDVHDKKV